MQSTTSPDDGMQGCYWRLLEAEKYRRSLPEVSEGEEKRGRILGKKHNPLRARTFFDLTSLSVFRFATTEGKVFLD